MKYWFCCVVGVLLMSHGFSQSWIGSYTASSSNSNEASAVSIGADSIYTITGKFDGFINFGGFSGASCPNRKGLYVAQIKNQTPLWATQICYSGVAGSSAITLDSADRVVVAGYFSDSLFVDGQVFSTDKQKVGFIARFNSIGDLLDMTIADCHNCHYEDLAVTPSGRLLATGAFYQYFNLDHSNLIGNVSENMFVIEFNSLLESIWADKSEGHGNYGKGVEVNSEDNVVVTGGYGDNAIIGGVNLPNENTNHNMFMLAYDDRRDVLYSQGITGSGETHGFSAAMNESGQSYFIGEYQGIATLPNGEVSVAYGGYDAIIYSLDIEGNYLWYASIGGTGNDHGWKTLIDPQGDAMVLLTIESEALTPGYEMNTRGFVEPRILKLRQTDGSLIDNNEVFTRHLAGRADPTDFSLRDGVMVAVGNMRDSVIVDTHVVVSSNSKDMFAVVFADTVVAYLSSTEFDQTEPFQVYPNPASEGFAILGDYQGSIQILDATGKVVLSKEVAVGEVVDISRLLRGLYFVRLVDKEQVLGLRLLVE